MLGQKQKAFNWIDAVWLLFIAVLVVLPPITEYHKQIILAVIGTFQLLEGRLIAWLPRRGHVYVVLIKIGLAALLLDHTGAEAAINSTYWPIYFLPIVTAATYFGPIGTLLWTSLASLTYCAYLIPARIEFDITGEAYSILAIRILFFFLAAMLVNRFAEENRRQAAIQKALAETLEETNRQLRRAEAEARRSERLAALGQLSAGLAHEIRNPLGVIKGSAELLTQKLQQTEPLAAELAGYISSEVNRLNGLVAQFLDFARPLRLDLRPEQITQIVDRAAESVRVQMPDARVTIERHYGPGLPTVLADEKFCESVFSNLIANAYQAMDGTGTLCLSASSESSNGSSGVLVTVEDTGPGVLPEMREQIFNPFITSKKDGVGLGLSIVAKIVDEHRGWIKLDPDSTKGARFRVFFPTEPPPQGTSKA
ncbi:MAG TPA: ATP-binding protein [Candidatus Aquilonibacter sp.]|nr:ATP-binding protein [Candidatus Aquilonibacter sp.]